MSGKKLFSAIAAVCLLFIVILGGGCGGGSHNDAVDPDNLSMASVMGTPEYNAMLAELEADGTMAKVERHGRYNYTGQENAKEEVLAAYESGKVVMLFEPTAKDVNEFLQLLESLSMNVEEFAPNTKGLELFAMAKKEDSDGKDHRCTYIVTHRADVILSGDIAESEPEGSAALEDDSGYEAHVVEKQTEDEPEYSEVEFQVDRWREFYKWIAGLDDVIKANSAFMSDYEVRAADDNDLTKLSEAQVVTYNLSVRKQINGIKVGRKYCTEFEHTMNRRNVLTLKIYSAHSFKSKDDFYIVQGKMSTNPMNFHDKTVWFRDESDYKMLANFVYGYTKEAGFHFEIDDSSKLSDSDLSLIEDQPSNVNRSSTYSKATTVSINGKVGVNKDGPSAEIGGGVSYSDSRSWTTTEYEIVNKSTSGSFAQAEWNAVFGYCGGGEKHDYEGYYKNNSQDPHNGVWWGVNATQASTLELELSAYGVFQVKKGYWKKNSTINLTGGFGFQDGCTRGRTNLYGDFLHLEFVEYQRDDHTDSGYKDFSFSLDQPPHAAVTKRKFALDSNGTSQISFTLLTEDNWTITNIPDWIKFTRTSGEATDEDGTLIYGQANQNNGVNPRYASIILTSGRESFKIEVGQRGTGQ